MRLELVVLAVLVSGLWVSDQRSTHLPAGETLVASARSGLSASLEGDFFAAVLDAPDQRQAPTPIELGLLDLANADRQHHGLHPLAFDAELLEIARARAADQAPLPALSHVDHTGEYVFERLLLGAGLDYALAGENLARLRAPESAAVERAHLALMRSPTHRANILEPEFDRLAVGATEDESGRIIFAQIFRAAR